jgi:hypothetical protein
MLKGYIGIEIPTKRYIAAYVKSQLGEQPIMNTEHMIGHKFYDLLQHQTNEDKTEFSAQYYEMKMKLYVNYGIFYKRGQYLNHTNIKNFNIFLEKEVKDKFRFYMDFMIEIVPNFKYNLPAVRKKLGIEEDAWDYDSMKKDYYRYRIRNKKPLLKLRSDYFGINQDAAF